MSSFAASYAVVIGIDDYRHGIAPLRTAVADARAIADVLTRGHGFAARLTLDGATDRAALETLFSRKLPELVGPDDRLVVYYAGHGIALDGDAGPEGFLVPRDARPEDSSSLLSMAWVARMLDALACRHLLLILDCCFAGSFRWASTRSFVPVEPVLYKRRYARFLAEPSWQVLTSASHNQLAADLFIGGLSKNLRDVDNPGQHSPFAAYLLEALNGAADQTGPGGERDGVITSTELYIYVRDQVETGPGAIQTPGLWPLPKHGRGEFVFEVPGEQPRLEPDPVLDERANPWRGLNAYGEEDAALFFGRERVVKALRERVFQEPCEQPLLAVVGASGTGKSSVVNAGLVPWARRERARDCAVVGPIRPGSDPRAAFQAALTELDATGPGRETPDRRTRLLVIDQFEEVYTLCRDSAARASALSLLERRLATTALRVVLTVRADFEPQLRSSPLAQRLSAPGARMVIPPMTADELRAIVEGPARARVMYFEPPELIDALVNEVVAAPGGLPLLSFTLSELYRRYLERDADDRALRLADYTAMGGVMGSLHSRATALYERATPDERATIEDLVLRMIAIEGGQLARRRVSLRELEYDDAAINQRVEDILLRFTDARLFVRGSAPGGANAATAASAVFVEPAHDTLVLAWDYIHVWLDRAHERLTLLRSVWRSAVEWSDHGRRPGQLWTADPRLDQLVALDREPRSGVRLNRLERGFLQASVARRRLQRWALVGATLAVLVGLSTATAYALVQAGEARSQAARADKSAEDAQQRAEEAKKQTARAEQAGFQVRRALVQQETSSAFQALIAGDVFSGATLLAQIIEDVQIYAPETLAPPEDLQEPPPDILTAFRYWQSEFLTSAEALARIDGPALVQWRGRFFILDDAGRLHKRADLVTPQAVHVEDSNTLVILDRGRARLELVDVANARTRLAIDTRGHKTGRLVRLDAPHHVGILALDYDDAFPEQTQHGLWILDLGNARADLVFFAKAGRSPFVGELHEYVFPDLSRGAEVDRGGAAQPRPALDCSKIGSVGLAFTGRAELPEVEDTGTRFTLQECQRGILEFHDARQLEFPALRPPKQRWQPGPKLPAPKLPAACRELPPGDEMVAPVGIESSDWTLCVTHFNLELASLGFSGHWPISLVAVGGGAEPRAVEVELNIRRTGDLFDQGTGAVYGDYVYVRDHGDVPYHLFDARAMTPVPLAPLPTETGPRSEGAAVNRAGSTFAVIASAREIWVYGLPGGERSRRLVLERDYGVPLALGFGDHATLLVVTDHPALVRVDALTGEFEWTVDPRPIGFSIGDSALERGELALSGDRTIAAARWNAAVGLFLVESGAPLTIPVDPRGVGVPAQYDALAFTEDGALIVGVPGETHASARLPPPPPYSMLVGAVAELTSERSRTGHTSVASFIRPTQELLDASAVEDVKPRDVIKIKPRYIDSK